MTYDLTTQRGCMGFLLDRRHFCRILARLEDEAHDANQRDEREARKLRELKDPMADRRADVLEAAVEKRREASRHINDKFKEVGEDLFSAADAIDANIPRDLLLDLLNVNLVDREAVKDAKGFKELVFVRGVENSVEQRGKDTKDGSPLFRACHLRFMHELIHNEELNRTAHNMLFGAGGMFEFIPQYQQMPDGTMKRLPPPLRVMDDTAPPPYSREDDASGGSP